MNSHDPGRFRWVICGLLFVVTISNYMDRQMLSVAAPVISAEFKLTNSDIATIANSFLVAYTVGQLFTGLFVDWIGARRGMTLAVIVWSFTAMSTAFARRVGTFCSFRFLLGLSESVNYPAGVKVAAEWFPPKELATAVGVFQSGSSVGAMIAPPLAAWLIAQFGWKAAFVLVAVPGLLWVPFWWKFYRPPETSPHVSDAERNYVLAGRAAARKSRRPWADFRTFLGQRAVWGISLARFLEEPAGWFYFTWLPLYLKNYRGVSLVHAGLLLTIPFLTFDIGKVGGGWISSKLIVRGWTLDRSRKVVLLVSALSMTASIPAIMTHTPLAFVLLISVATFGHGSYATTVQTLPADIVEPARVGTVYGMTAFAGGAGSIVFMYATGRMADSMKSFDLPFIVAGLLPLLGYAAFVALVPRIQPVQGR